MGRNSSVMPVKLLECSDFVPPYSRFGQISFCLTPGEWICISGPSGVGKSSLLFALAGLINPISGKIQHVGSERPILGSVSLRQFRRDLVHLVPQSLPLFSQLDVLHNVLFVQRLLGDGVSPDACRQLLIKLGLQGRLEFFPSQLSIGEKQRVCVARGLATNAPVLLIDEPTSNLDRDCVTSLVQIFRETTQVGRALLVVSNDPRFTPFADRVMSLDYAENSRSSDAS
jgi:putative ABC transport system ATP-binding protein